MRRGEIVTGVVIAVTVLGSWSYSLVYDAAEVTQESYEAGQAWARQHDPTVRECVRHALQLPGRGTNSVAWQNGCKDAIGFPY